MAFGSSFEGCCHGHWHGCTALVLGYMASRHHIHSGGLQCPVLHTSPVALPRVGLFRSMLAVLRLNDSMLDGRAAHGETQAASLGGCCTLYLISVSDILCSAQSIFSWPTCCCWQHTSCSKIGPPASSCEQFQVAVWCCIHHSMPCTLVLFTAAAVPLSTCFPQLLSLAKNPKGPCLQGVQTTHMQPPHPFHCR